MNAFKTQSIQEDDTIESFKQSFIKVGFSKNTFLTVQSHNTKMTLKIQITMTTVTNKVQLIYTIITMNEQLHWLMYKCQNGQQNWTHKSSQRERGHKYLNRHNNYCYRYDDYYYRYNNYYNTITIHIKRVITSVKHIIAEKKDTMVSSIVFKTDFWQVVTQQLSSLCTLHNSHITVFSHLPTLEFQYFREHRISSSVSHALGQKRMRQLQLLLSHYKLGKKIFWKIYYYN